MMGDRLPLQPFAWCYYSVRLEPLFEVVLDARAFAGLTVGCFAFFCPRRPHLARKVFWFWLQGQHLRFLGQDVKVHERKGPGSNFSVAERLEVRDVCSGET